MEGELLAFAIQQQILAKVPTTNRGIKPSNFFVLRCTKCPAVLIDTTFIDNADDNMLLLNNVDDFARAIACGVTDYVVNTNL